MRERLITLLTAVAALALVIFLLSPHRPNVQKSVSLPTTEDRGSEGLKGLFTWLQREQLAVVSFRKRYTELSQDKSIPERGNVLIASMPAPKEMMASEWSALSRWLGRGNSLILLGAVYHHPAWTKGEDCFCDVKKFLARYAWTLEGEDTEVDSKEPKENNAKSLQESIAVLQASIKNHLPQASRLVALSAHPLLQGVKTLDVQTTPDLLKKHWTLAGDNTDNLALRLFSVADSGGIAAWQMNAGAGRIVLMLTPDVFSNGHLNHADNARFLGNLLSQSLAPEGRLLFDDYHFGLSKLYDPEHFFKDERLHKTLACLGLLWLFYVIGYTTRLAPVRIPVVKLSVLDFIEVMAGFFARRVNKRLLAEALVKHLLVDICKHRRLHNESEAWLWLEQHSQIPHEQLRLLKQTQSKQRLSLLHLSNAITYIRTVTL